LVLPYLIATITISVPPEKSAFSQKHNELDLFPPPRLEVNILAHLATDLVGGVE